MSKYPSFNQGKINPRIFIVGCSRSGTTLLQTLIASHPSIITFPETGFFYKTIGNSRLKNILATIGLSVQKEMKCLKYDILQRLDREYLSQKVPSQPISFGQCVINYLSILDEIASERNKKVWVEKTPLHVMNVRLIQKYVPNVKIIHIVRDGCEVVASIRNRAIKYPKRFNKQDKEYAIKLWNKCIKMTLKYGEKDGQYIIKYEDLIDEPREVLKTVGEFLNIDFGKIDLNRREKVLKESTLNMEKWKKNVSKKIDNRNSKFEELFSESEQHMIKNGLIENKFYNW